MRLCARVFVDVQPIIAACAYIEFNHMFDYSLRRLHCLSCTVLTILTYMTVYDLHRLTETAGRTHRVAVSENDIIVSVNTFLAT
jgi:hypothetical protein